MKITKKDINDILKEIKEPFVSEADFQFYLAWELQKKYKKEADIILEYPIEPSDGERQQHYDIAIKDKDTQNISFIELKYKTSKAKINRHGIDINLKTQGAVPQGKYKFIKDIQRMEQAFEKYPNNHTNYCIFLTNESKYWDTDNKAENSKSKYISSSINNVINKKGSWIEDSEKKSLDNPYSGDWILLKKLKKSKEFKEFKYLLIKVKKNAHKTTK